MIEIRLRQAMTTYSRRTGEHLTYEALARRTGLARTTLESMATRPGYNASLNTIDRICDALRCTPEELLHYEEGAGRESAGRE